MISMIVGRAGIYPGWHMNKEHWITIDLSSDIEPEELYRYIALSFKLTKQAADGKTSQSK